MLRRTLLSLGVVSLASAQVDFLEADPAVICQKNDLTFDATNKVYTMEVDVGTTVQKMKMAIDFR